MTHQVGAAPAERGRAPVVRPKGRPPGGRGGHCRWGRRGWRPADDESRPRSRWGRARVDLGDDVEREGPNKTALTIITLLALRGCWRGEIEKLLWEEVEAPRSIAGGRDRREVPGGGAGPACGEAAVVHRSLQRRWHADRVLDLDEELQAHEPEDRQAHRGGLRLDQDRDRSAQDPVPRQGQGRMGLRLRSGRLHPVRPHRRRVRLQMRHRRLRSPRRHRRRPLHLGRQRRDGQGPRRRLGRTSARRIARRRNHLPRWR